jgi:HAE1 family hydrophobic/amphiphilic exporter-1
VAAAVAVPLILPFALIGLVALVANIFTRTTKYRYLAFGALFGLMFIGASLGGNAFAKWKQDQVFKFSFIPSTDQGQININVQLPAGSSLDRTQDVVSRIEDSAMHDPEVKYVTSRVGQQSGGFSGGGASGSNYAQVAVTLYDKRAPMDSIRGIFSRETERLRASDVSSSVVASRLLQKIGRIPGASVFVDSGQGGGFGAPIQLSLGSNDHQLLVATAKKIRDGLQSGAVPGVINPDISSKEGKPELQLDPNRARMADANVSLAELGSALRTLYQGNDDAKLRVHGDEYGIRVMLDLKDRNDANAIGSVPVVFKQGHPITVGQLTSPKIAPAFDQIQRRARLEEVQISANLLPGYVPGTVNAAVTKWMTDNKIIPEGVRLRPLGQADATARELPFMMMAFGLGFVLVYMLLASLYDNLLYPLIIQFAQPQALVGGLLALVITDKALNVVGFIGLFALMGLVGKNAILLVDYTNTLRHRGRTRHDALVEAGPTRLRPILMTTLALILGMMPVALALGRGSEFRDTIGIIIIGGITLSTMLTLFVIPCSYTIMDDMSIAIGRFVRGTPTDQPPATDLTTGITESTAHPNPSAVFGGE